MATATMADLLKQAEDAGISNWTPTNGEKYELEVIRANGGTTKKGDPKFGVQFEVLSGPDKDKSFWTNFNLIAVKNNGEPNSAGLAITFRDLDTLGADASTVAGWDVDSDSISDSVADALVGTQVSAEVQVSSSNGYENVNLRRLTRLSSASPAPAAAPPAENRPF